MGLADTAKLIVDLSLKGNFVRQLSTANRALGKFDSKLDHTQGRAYLAGQQIGTGIQRGVVLAASGVGILASQVAFGLDQLVELEQLTAQTQAVLKSTGGVAGVTATQVRDLAEEFESMNATIDDKVIQSGENLLLTFTKIRGEAFKPTLAAALDLSTAMKQDLRTSVLQVGKAMQDPERGLLALRRAGVSFSKDQIKRIKTLQKEGKLYEAQQIILAELNKEFGGSFLAQGGTTGAKIKKFGDAIEDLQKTLAIGMLPVVSNIADALNDLFRDPAVIAGVEQFGKDLAALFTPDRIKAGIGAIKDVFNVIKAVAGPAAAAVGAMVNAFSKLPPDLRNILIGAFAVNKLTGGLVTNIAGGIGQAIKNMVTGSMNVEAGVVNVAGGAGGVPGAPGKGGGGNLLPAIGVAGIILSLAVPIGEAFAKALPDSFKGPAGHTGQSEAQRRITEARAQQNQRGGPADHFDAKGQQKKLADIALQVQRKGEQTAGKLDDTKSAVDDTKTKVGTTGQAIQNTTRSSALTNAAIGAAATAASTAAIVGAIYAARPIVNVTNVTKSTTVQNRYGPGNGSQGTDNGHAGNSGPLP